MYYYIKNNFSKHKSSNYDFYKLVIYCFYKSINDNIIFLIYKNCYTYNKIFENIFLLMYYY